MSRVRRVGNNPFGPMDEKALGIAIKQFKVLRYQVEMFDAMIRLMDVPLEAEDMEFRADIEILLKTFDRIIRYAEKLLK